MRLFFFFLGLSGVVSGLEEEPGKGRKDSSSLRKLSSKVLLDFDFHCGCVFAIYYYYLLECVIGSICFIDKIQVPIFLP